MGKDKFNIDINAPKKKVWEVLWTKSSYEKWTSVFAEKSTVETDNWKEGSKVLFLDGEGMGMVSRVEANKPEEFMSFAHLGEYKNGVEDTTSEQVKKWSGATEDYILKEENGISHLTIEMESSGFDENMMNFFKATMPKALQKVKELSENN